MSRDASGDVVLLPIRDNSCFATILRTKDRLLLIVCLFLKDTSFKHKRREFLQKNISKFCFSFYITQILLTYYMQWIVFRSSTGQIVNWCSLFKANQYFDWNELFTQFRFQFQKSWMIILTGYPLWVLNEDCITFTVSKNSNSKIFTYFYTI